VSPSTPACQERGVVILTAAHGGEEECACQPEAISFLHSYGEECCVS